MTIKTNYFDGGTLLPSDLINEKMSLLTDGVYGAGDFLASQHSPANLSVDIAAGEAQKNGYYIKSDSIVNPAITANTSGYNRKDIIVLNVNTTSKVTTIIAVAGTPSSSPTAPLPTASQLKIAEVFVGNNVSVINTANITDKRINVDLFTPKANLSDFANALSPSGYQKLPSGLIIQWASTVAVGVAPGGSNAAVIDWPIAFPNACLKSFANPNGDGVTANNVNGYTFGATELQVRVVWVNNTASTQTFAINIFAIGW